MTPQAALRRLESILQSTDAPKATLDEAEGCFKTLWDALLLGNTGVQVGHRNTQYNNFT